MARTNASNDDNLRILDVPCAQCGQGIPKTTIEKRKSRNVDDWDLCADCVRVPSTNIRYHHPVLGLIWCYPHFGEVDALFRPLTDSGELYRPGERLCGHSDCVNLKHIAGLKPRKKNADTLETLLAQIEMQEYNKRHAKVATTIKSGASPKVN